MIKISYSPKYILSLPPKHPFPIDKYRLLPEKLINENIISQSNFFYPNKIDIENLYLTHTREYVQKVLNLELSNQEVRKIGFPLSKELIERELIITQGTLQCAFYAQENGVSLNIAGGTHHSYSDYGSGFCIFNDVAVASNYLLKNDYYQKIMIVDLDVHQGNGNAKIFENNKNIFTFSMHGEKNFPLKKELSDLDIPLPDNTDDQTYLKILYDTLPLLIKNFRPQIIFYISGVDILQGDKFGRLAISLDGCKKRDNFVFSICKKNNIPIVVVMGGGYSKDINIIVDAHFNTYKSAQDIFSKT